MSSLFDKHFKRSLTKIYDVVGDHDATITTRTGTYSVRVVIDTEYSVNEFNMQSPRTVACFSRDDVPKSPHPCTIQLADGRCFKSDGMFVGQGSAKDGFYATDEYEWCIAIIEVK